MGRRRIASAGGQIIGERSEQQDCFAMGPARLRSGESATVYVVADGMGGHSGGAIAARSAVEAFLKAADLGGFDSWPQLLDKSLLTANRAIGECARTNPSLKGMGCTLLAVIPLGGILHYISVGDSPLFRLRANGLERVNCDHSMAPLIDEAAANAEMTPEEARGHPQRSALRSALVGSPVSLIDMQTVETHPGEIFLLASDGLLSIDEPRIAQTLIAQAPHGPETIVTSLLDQVEAQQAPDQDNCTLIVLCESDAPARGLASRWPALAILAAGIAMLTTATWIISGQFSAGGRTEQDPTARTPAGTVAGSIATGNPRIPGRPYEESIVPLKIDQAGRAAKNTRTGPSPPIAASEAKPDEKPVEKPAGSPDLPGTPTSEAASSTPDTATVPPSPVEPSAGDSEKADPQ